MITYVTGSLFQSPAKTLVNTVNTVGVMGKGVAFEFKRIYPEMFEEYQVLCGQGKLRIGTLWLYRSPNKLVLNFPTKKHWRQPYRAEYVDSGLRTFVERYDEMGIESIAFPTLGCGNGELDFEKEVQPLMEKYLAPLPIEVFIYPDRSDAFTEPEHLNPKEMKKWLRSIPQSLPFTEVWDDLVQLIAQQDTYETVSKENTFTAEIGHDPKVLYLNTLNNRRSISYESLSAFWLQLRDHGISYRNIAPGGIDREVSYLTAVFRRLPYIKPVQVAESYGNLHAHPSTGLQVLPEAFLQNKKYLQVNMFETLTS